MTATPLESIPVPPGQRRSAQVLWAARVLLQSDPDHINRLMCHLRDGLAAPPPRP